MFYNQPNCFYKQTMSPIHFIDIKKSGVLHNVFFFFDKLKYLSSTPTYLYFSHLLLHDNINVENLRHDHLLRTVNIFSIKRK